MRITAELSLYPLTADALPRILAFIGDLEDPRVTLVVNQMSSQLSGELRDVLAVVGNALERSFRDGDSQVLVVKFLNADLPIEEPPDLGTVP